MIRFSNIRYLSLLILLVLTALLYHTRFSNIATIDEESNPLRPIIVLLTIVNVVLFFDIKAWIKSRFIKFFLSFVLIIELIGFVIDQMGISKWYQVDAQNILMSFLFLLIGYSNGIKISYKQLRFLVFVYSFFVAVAVYSQLMQHAGGFVITNLYISYGKNTMGVMCASSCIALLFLALFEEKKIFKYCAWMLFFIILILDVSIRARASYVTIFLISILCIYRFFKGRITRRIIVWAFAGILLFMISLFLIPGFFNTIGEYIWNSFTQNQNMDDLSSGRTALNKFAINIINRSPLFGNLELQYDYYGFRVHNYPLRVLSSYGILGSLPLLILLFYFVIYVMKKIFKSGMVIQNVGFYVFMVPLIISLVEPTFPYSPGTGVIFSFVLLGFSICQIETKKNHIFSYQNKYS